MQGRTPELSSRIIGLPIITFSTALNRRYGLGLVAASKALSPVESIMAVTCGAALYAVRRNIEEGFAAPAAEINCVV